MSFIIKICAKIIKINIDALGSSCLNIDDFLEKEDLVLNRDSLLYLATNNKGIIEKNNYILEIIIFWIIKYNKKI